MKKGIPFIIACFITVLSGAQSIDSMHLAETRRIVSALAGDHMKGRGNFTPEIAEASCFIANEFRQAGLSFFEDRDSYLHAFHFTKEDGTETPELVNVIGMLEGRSLKNEIVIFSAHYDHLGKGFNGANDNASGTTALIMLAHHFAEKKDNERTLIFCAFSGEELGLYGSRFLAGKMEGRYDIKAVINIEMIGRPGYKKRSFFLTGDAYSNMKKIFHDNIKHLPVAIRPEPAGDLFYRSDNYPFAIRGVAAHSVMSGDDHTDGCYHRPCDRLRTLDLPHMSEIIKTIAVACGSIISGKDTPLSIKPRPDARYPWD